MSMVCAIGAVAAAAAGAAAAQSQPLKPAAAADGPALEITRDTVLDPAKSYGGIVIKASGITIDGRGAWVIGAQEGPASRFKQVGVFAKGVSRVTLKNVHAKGWEIGLKVEDGGQWVVEGCDFSDNFHNPDFGWGELGRRGGIVLERVHHSTLRKNKANRVWDACVLVHADDNTIEENDFSHTSNTCLKPWTSCRNLVRKDNLSYGLRIKPGETHARDSACVLVESGSNDNRFLENDCAHGGDGVFVRALNGWVSSGNTCVGNHGAGIALVGDTRPEGPKWKAFHWIIEQNTLAENRWGIYMRQADWIDMAGNVFRSNEQATVQNDGNVTNRFEHPDDTAITAPPQAVCEGPATGAVGQKVLFDTSRSTDPRQRPLRFRWDLGDGVVSHEARLEHVFQAPGFYRIGLTVNNGRFSDLAWRDFYAVEQLAEIGTEGQAAEWSWIDPASTVQFSDDREVRISGASSLHARVDPYSGNRVNLLYPASRKAGWPLKGKTHLVFWVKAVNENVLAWQGPNPIVTLYESEKRLTVLAPEVDLMSQRPNNEEREGWTYFAVPLAGSSLWKRAGEGLATVNYLTIGFDSWGAPPLRIWIDGLAMK